MKRYLFLILIVFLFGNLAYADKEFKFRKNILYTITYQIDDDTTRTLEDIYFRDLWDSSAIEKTPYMTASGEVYNQTKSITYMEFLKTYKDGRKESFLIPAKNIVEIKMVIAKGFDAGSSSTEEMIEDTKLEMKIK